jgi:MFS family permease
VFAGLLLAARSIFMSDTPSRATRLWTADPGASIAGTARQLDIYAALQATMTSLTGGVFLTAYALALGADPLVIAVLAAVPLAAKVSQVFTSSHIERAGHWPRTALVCGAIGRVLLLATAAIPFLFDIPRAAMVLVAIIALASFAASFFDLALLTWMAELVPPGVRGRFLGARNRTSGLAGQVTALAAALVVQQIAGGTTQSPTVFAALFAVGAVIGLMALPVLARVPPPRRIHSRVELPRLHQMLMTPIRDDNFRVLLSFAVLWHIALGLSAPFLIVLMLEDLGLSLVTVTALTALTSIVAAGTMTYWGRLGDHFGTKTVLRAGTYLITVPTVLWLVVTPERTWPIVAIQIMTGLGWGAYNTNVNNLALKLAPERRGPSYVASLGAIAGISEAIGPLAGGVIIATVAASTASTLLPYYVVVLIAFVLRAIATVVPGYAHEPGGVPVGRMVRTMGRVRSMNVEETFAPLFTHLYTHVARVADFVAREPALARRAS